MKLLIMKFSPLPYHMRAILLVHLIIRYCSVVGYERMCSRSECTDFKTSRSNLKILGARRLTWSQFHIESQQKLVAAVKNVVARATWRHGFVLYILVTDSCEKIFCISHFRPRRLRQNFTLKIRHTQRSFIVQKNEV
jgi:hypothetical protein